MLMCARVGGYGFIPPCDADCAGPNQALLGQAKAHEAILAAMRAHPGEVALQQRALAALGNMAFGNGRVRCMPICCAVLCDCAQAYVGLALRAVFSGVNKAGIHAIMRC